MCQKHLTTDDFRTVSRKGKRYASTCRACELRVKMEKELLEQERRRNTQLSLARAARRTVTPDD